MRSHESEDVEIVLEGGPTGLPRRIRMQLSDDNRLKVKLPYRGGHEHFELVDELLSPRVYRWTMRTRIAE
jgi:Family of unknown function (DUF5988)